MITLEFVDFEDMLGFAQKLTWTAPAKPVHTEAAPTPAKPVHTEAAPTPAPEAVTPPAPVHAEIAPPPAPAPPPVAPQLVAPSAAPMPTTQKTYTPGDLQRVAMVLMDSGKQDALIQLLGTFGVSSLPDLRPDQCGAFATALRGMGAPI